MDVSVLFEDFYKEFPELREESQLDMGKKVEQEHEPTVEWIESKVKDSGELPPSKEIYASIAKDHLDEFPNYYTALDKMEKELKEKVSLSKLHPGLIVNCGHYGSSIIICYFADEERFWGTDSIADYKEFGQHAPGWYFSVADIKGIMGDVEDYEDDFEDFEESFGPMSGPALGSMPREKDPNDGIPWPEEIKEDDIDYDPYGYDAQYRKEVQGLKEGKIGDFMKGAVKQMGQSTLGAINKIPGVGKVVQAGQQAVQKSADAEATLYASDINGYLQNILDALKNYVGQQPAPAQQTAVQESFRLEESLLLFELEHLTEAMDQPTFKKLVGTYIKNIGDNPSKILTDPASLQQLRGIFNGAKKFGLQLPVTSKDFENVVAAYTKTSGATQQPVAGQAVAGEVEPEVAAVPEQVGAQSRTVAYSKMAPRLAGLLQDPQAQFATMKIISAALAQASATSPAAAKLAKQLKS